MVWLIASPFLLDLLRMRHQVHRHASCLRDDMSLSLSQLARADLVMSDMLPTWWAGDGRRIDIPGPAAPYIVVLRSP